MTNKYQGRTPSTIDIPHGGPTHPLTTAHELAHARHEEVHRVHRLPPIVVVIAHVESLDLLGVVVNEYGRLELLLGEPPLVLGREVGAELDLRELPLRRVLRYLLLQVDYRVPVREAHERRAYELLQPPPESLVEEIGKEREILVALLEDFPDHVLQHPLGAVHRARRPGPARRERQLAGGAERGPDRGDARAGAAVHGGCAGGFSGGSNAAAH